MSNRAQILISAIDQTKAVFESIKNGLASLFDRVSNTNDAFANLGVAVSAAGLVAMLKSAIDTGDALDEMSQRVGVSVETLSVWKPVAEQSGVSSEAFEKGLRTLPTRILEAVTGSKEAAHAFTAMGIELKKLDGSVRASDQVLLELAERFKAMPDGAEKTALAMRLFGKSGAELIPFLNQGRDGINELAAEMQALGIQMSSETAAQAGAFNDSLDKLQLSASSIGNQLIASLLPALNEIASGMVESAKQGGLLRTALDGVVLVLKTLALGAATVGKAFMALGEAMGAGLAAAVEALKGNVSGAKLIIADLKENMIKRLDDLASFNDSLFNPQPIVVPQIRVGADLLLNQVKVPRPSPKGAPDNTSAQTALMKAQLDAEFTQLKDGLTRQQTALDNALEDRLISVRNYYTILHQHT